MKVFTHELENLYNVLGDESDRAKVVKLWKGLNLDITDILSWKSFSQEVHSWAVIAHEAELAEATLNRRHSAMRATVLHNHRADSRCTNRTTEENKYNDVPRNRQDYSPQPIRMTPTDEARVIRGQPARKPRRFEPSNHGGPPRFKNSQPNNQPRPPKPSSSGQSSSGPTKNELMAEGRCFKCHEKGHLERNCPRNGMVASGSRSRPPGLASSSIRFNVY